MDLKLKDKVIVVGGGTGGIGKAIVKAFAEEGCKLAVSATSLEKANALKDELGLDDSHFRGYKCDMTDEEEVKAFIQSAHKDFGRIDTIVPCAGYEGSHQSIQDVDTQEFMKVYAVNVFGPMYMMKYSAPFLLEQKKGSIVVIASDGAYTTAPGMSAYCSSKHAVAGLTKTVTTELGPHGIHVNYVCPGAVDTDMMRRIEKKTFGDSKTPEEAERIFADAYLDKRYCKVEEVANLTLYLASDLASHIMGSGIRLDGGLDALC